MPARRASSPSTPASVIDGTTNGVGKLVNRYGAAGATKFTDACQTSVTAEAVPSAVKALRAVFDSEKTLSREWRMGQLKAFHRMLTEGRGELCEALRVDLGKHPFQGFATELGLVISEVENAMAHLDEWMAPEYTANSALNIPCWSSTQADPLGVVLVMGAWNYRASARLDPSTSGSPPPSLCLPLPPPALTHCSVDRRPPPQRAS